MNRCWASKDKVTADLVPGPVGFEGPVKIIEPEFTIAVASLAEVSAVEENDVEDLREVISVIVGVGKVVNEEIPLLWVLVGKEGIDFGNTGDSAE